MAIGHKTGGRKKGVPNKSTADVRAAIAIVAQRSVPKIEDWLEAIEDPAKRLSLFLDMCEYHIPKLARTEVVGKDGGNLVVHVIRHTPDADSNPSK